MNGQRPISKRSLIPEILPNLREFEGTSFYAECPISPFCGVRRIINKLSVKDSQNSAYQHRININVNIFYGDNRCFRNLIADLVHNAPGKNLYVDTVVNNNVKSN